MMSDQQFEAKKVLVTGGSRGIGFAISDEFAKRGAQVAVNYCSNQQAAEEALNRLSGTNHIAVQADVADAHQAKALIDEVVSQLGGIDILINNAGISIFHRVAEVEFEQWQDAWQRTIDANLLGPANLCFLAAKEMMKTGGGRIVNISSRGAFRGEPENLLTELRRQGSTR